MLVIFVFVEESSSSSFLSLNLQKCVTKVTNVVNTAILENGMVGPPQHPKCVRHISQFPYPLWGLALVKLLVIPLSLSVR